MTKTFKISEESDKNEVEKLTNWDKDNLITLYGNSNIIYII